MGLEPGPGAVRVPTKWKPAKTTPSPSPPAPSPSTSKKPTTHRGGGRGAGTSNVEIKYYKADGTPVYGSTTEKSVVPEGATPAEGANIKKPVSVAATQKTVTPTEKTDVTTTPSGTTKKRLKGIPKHDELTAKELAQTTPTVTDQMTVEGDPRGIISVIPSQPGIVKPALKKREMTREEKRFKYAYQVYAQAEKKKRIDPILKEGKKVLEKQQKELETQLEEKTLSVSRDFKTPSSLTQTTPEGNILTLTSKGLVTIKSKTGKVIDSYRIDPGKARSVLRENEYYQLGADVINKELAQTAKKYDEKLVKTQQEIDLQIRKDLTKEFSVARFGEIKFKKEKDVKQKVEDFYKQLDVSAGGILPAFKVKGFDFKGVTKEEAKIEKEKRKELISELKQESLKVQAQVKSSPELQKFWKKKSSEATTKLALSALMVGGTSALVASQPVSVAKGILIPVTSIGGTKEFQYGTATPEEKRVLENKELFRGAIEYAYEQEDVKKGAFHKFLVQDVGLVRTAEGFLTKKGEERFKESISDFYKFHGRDEKDISAATSLAIKLRTKTDVALFGSNVATNFYSERIGGKYVLKAFKYVLKEPSKRAAWRTFSKTAVPIGKAGFVEASSMEIGGSITRYKSPRIKDVVTQGFYGAGTAGVFGGLIAGTAVKTPKLSKLLQKAGYYSDPHEKLGDISESFSKKVKSAITKKPYQEPVILADKKTLIFTVGRKKGFEKDFLDIQMPDVPRPKPKSSSKVKSFTFQTSSDKLPSYTITSDSLSKKTPVTATSKTLVSSLTKTPTSAHVPVTTLTKTQVKTPITTLVTTPVKTPITTFETTPVLTPVTTPVETPVSTPVETPVTTPVTVPVNVPRLLLPPLFLPKFDLGTGRGKRKQRGKRRFKYTPSATAVAFGIKGKKTKFKTGLGLRPITSTTRTKSKLEDLFKLPKKKKKKKVKRRKKR